MVMCDEDNDNGHATRRIGGGGDSNDKSML
jgi:hypothetical protein